MALNTSDPSAVRQAAHDILSRPEYQTYHQSTWQRVLYYFSHPLDLLNLIINWIGELLLGSGSAGWIAWGVVIVAFIGLVIFIVRFQRSTSGSGAVHIHYAPKTEGRSERDLIAEAEALEAAGKWRDAIRVRYTALIVSLADDGIVRSRAGKTTGEYAREVSINAPGIATDFGMATRVFEWVWYGDGTPDADEAAEFRTLTSSVTAKAMS